MMNRRKLLLYCLGAIIIGCLAILLFENKEAYQTSIDPSKIVFYEDADAVIRDSALIVRVKKISETPTEYILEHGLSDCFTISTVEVQEVFQSSDTTATASGNKIDILESQWIDEEKKVIHHTEGYLKMETGKQYLLFLGSNPSLNNYYPLGLLYGKIPIDPKETIFLGDGYEEIKTVIEDLRQKYLS